MFWYAVCTTPRYERKVDVHLPREGITTSLPEIEGLGRRKDRQGESILSDFSRIRVHQHGCRLRTIKTRGVVGILGNRETPAVSAEKQIDTTSRIVRNGKVWKA
jgi:hypothetical protein